MSYCSTAGASAARIVDTLTNLFVDRVKGKVPFFTRVAIETTGLADPAPILHTLMTHGVQHLLHPPVLLPAWPSEDRRTRMVFITRDLPREAIETTLAAVEEAVEECPSPQSSPRERAEGGTRRDFLVSAGSVAVATAFAGSA